MRDRIFWTDLYNLIERSRAAIRRSEELVAVSKETISTSRAIKHSSDRLMIEVGESATDQIALESG